MYCVGSLAYIWILINISALVSASQGDSDAAYMICTVRCEASTCQDTNISRFGAGFPYWDCKNDCSYDCMQEITADRSLQGYGPLKYFGHWPFLRLMGLEEPASMLFSFLNAVPYFISLIKAVHQNADEMQNHFMGYWLYAYYLISIETWLASAFYHSRKTELASLIDFASALFYLSYSLWLAVRRIWGPQASSAKVTLTFTLFISLFAYRLSRMCAGLVSFDDHMRVSISVAVFNVLTWLSWLIFSTERIRGNGHYRYLCLVSQLWFSLAALLELFDFPAIWGIYDAHSLWHAATIPLGFIWAYFWEADMEAAILTDKTDKIHL